MELIEEKRFAENMQRLREERGWSQGELARRMVAEGWETYSQMTVSRTEKLDRPIRLGEASAIARLFGVSLPAMTASAEIGADVLELLREARARLISANQAFDSSAISAEKALTVARRMVTDGKIPDGSPYLEWIAEIEADIAELLNEGGVGRRWRSRNRGERQAEA